RGEGGAGFVESNVPIGADSQDLQVHAASLRNLRFVPGAGLADVAREPVGRVHRVIREVDVRGEFGSDHVRVRLRVVAGKPHIFIEGERLRASEAHLTRLIAADQLRVEGKRRGTGGQSENRIRLAFEQFADGVRGDWSDLSGILGNNNFHANIFPAFRS